jgi:hypothetical protein
LLLVAPNSEPSAVPSFVPSAIPSKKPSFEPSTAPISEPSELSTLSSTVPSLEPHLILTTTVLGSPYSFEQSSISCEVLYSWIDANTSGMRVPTPYFILKKTG